MDLSVVLESDESLPSRRDPERTGDATLTEDLILESARRNRVVHYEDSPRVQELSDDEEGERCLDESVMPVPRLPSVRSQSRSNVAVSDNDAMMRAQSANVSFFCDFFVSNLM